MCVANEEGHSGPVGLLPWLAMLRPCYSGRSRCRAREGDERHEGESADHGFIHSIAIVASAIASMSAAQAYVSTISNLGVIAGR
jgi:hypothetical protein